MHRRTFLRAAVAAGGSAITGCAGLPLGRTRLNLTVLNRDEALHRVRIQLLRRDAGELDRATVYDREVVVPAATDSGASVVERAGVARSRPYLVRADPVGLRRRVAPYHFYPDCAGEDGPEERLYVELVPDDGGLHVGFDQNRC